MAEFFTFLLLTAIVGIGYFKGMLWLSAIGGILLFTYMTGQTDAPVPTGPQAKKPKVRPIIIQRHYKGPASIYPAMNTMRINPNWNCFSWYENALRYPGMFVNSMLRSKVGGIKK